MAFPTVRVFLAAFVIIACRGGGSAEAAPPPAGPEAASDVLSHTVTTVRGQPKALADYRGKVLLIVNTASKCGFTPQYGPLQQLYAKYKGRGFEVLAFPSNDFGGQEPLSEPEVESFCSAQYGVTFPLFAKVHAKGEGISPLYRTLTEQSPPELRGEIRWNFTKFLVSREGKVLARYEPVVDPLNAKLTADLEKALGAPAPK